MTYRIELTKDVADRVVNAGLTRIGTYLVGHEYEDLKDTDKLRIGVVGDYKHPLDGHVGRITWMGRNGDLLAVEMELRGNENEDYKQI